jgi:hypothetical protein
MRLLRNKKQDAIAAALKSAEVNAQLLPVNMPSHQPPVRVDSPTAAVDINRAVAAEDPVPDPAQLNLDDGNAWIIIQMRPDYQTGVQEVWKQGPQSFDWWCITSGLIEALMIARSAEAAEHATNQVENYKVLRAQVEEEIRGKLKDVRREGD